MRCVLTPQSFSCGGNRTCIVLMDAPELRGDDGPGGWRAVWMYPRYGTRRECLGIVRDGKLTRPSKGVFDALQSALPATNGPTGATSMCCHWIHVGSMPKYPRETSLVEVR